MVRRTAQVPVRGTDVEFGVDPDDEAYVRGEVIKPGASMLEGGCLL